MPLDMGLVAWVEEAMAPVGTVTWRRMMGGATFYCGGTVFAIIGSQDTLYFKADAETDAQWDAIGAERFSFDMGGVIKTMNYRVAPDAVLDDADEFRRWALLGLEAGRRAPVKKPRAKKKG